MDTELLRGITRQMATAENMETVLRSIVDALVERGQAVLARIFLLIPDTECPICRTKIEAGEQKASSERVSSASSARMISGERASVRVAS